MNWMNKEAGLDRDMSANPSGRAEPTTQGRAQIGQSVHIKGTLVGKEDLTIDGTVEGEIRLEGHALTIGTHGVIKANVRARTIVIHGRLEGNVSGDDQVELGASASVRGDLRAARISIQDGASFKGGIDMGGDKSATS